MRAAEPPRNVLLSHSDATDYFIPLVTDADGHAYAAIYKPINAAEEVIYLPDEVEPTRRWVSLALEWWSQADGEAFPAIADWTHRPEWMAADERTALNAVLVAERELADKTAELTQQLAAARDLLSERRDAANRSERLLLTETADPLVAAVADMLRQIGFEVEDLDQRGARQKVEDLRVRDGDWVAIAEVKRL